MREILITKAEAGQRLDRFLGKYLSNTSAGFRHKMLRKKNIKLNGGKAEGNEKMKEGDCIQIYFSEETLEKFCAGTERIEKRQTSLSKEEKELRQHVKLLYKDEDVLIFHKPAGMLSQKAEKKDDSLNDYLFSYCLQNGYIKKETLSTFHPSVANRLDRNTSGIVLCGITVRGLQMLSQLLRDRGLEKYYLCLVKGEVTKNQTITGYLVKDEKKNTVRLFKDAVPDGDYIQTKYEVLKTSKKASLLRVQLITGKSHQIRAHLASIQHPILGDYKYGDRTANQEIKKELGISYQMLHSFELRVPAQAPIASESLKGLKITDPVPEQFLRTAQYFGLECV